MSSLWKCANQPGLCCATLLLYAYTLMAAVAGFAEVPAKGGIAVNATSVEQWDVFEVVLKGPAEGNPFVDTQLAAEFRQGDRVFTPEGFYDGEGTYRIRFMPDAPGEWSFCTVSNRPALDGKSGAFTCKKTSAGNHGPVRVRNTWYLAYADGTPYFQVGTTCYAWTHQPEELQEQTLRTLAASPFNKLRMCVFPKHYTYNRNEPPLYPFAGAPLRKWDFTRFSPAFWRHFERRVAQLRDMGIEADLILFHPYDRWGFATMEAASDDRYLRYAVARLAAYRNVWWSFANEFDLMKEKTEADWDRFFQIVQQADPYDRLRGNHNCREFYDHTKPWVTHASIQSAAFERVPRWREQYRKPLLIDECRYEGNVPHGWGNLTAPQMARFFWLGAMRGAYVGHGETYMHPEDLLWWSKGGVLHGESPARIAFFRQIMTAGPPFERLEPLPEPTRGVLALAEPGQYYLFHFTDAGEVRVNLPGDRPYRVDGIDAWNMTVTPLADVEPGQVRLETPRGDYLLRLATYAPGERRRPQITAVAEPAEGVAPLQVRFRAEGGEQFRWIFGDGAQSVDANPEHTYTNPGVYMAALTVTDDAGLSSTGFVTVVVDSPTVGSLVKVGFAEGDTPAVTVHGDVLREANGAYRFADAQPWRWLAVGDRPLTELEGLRSFTICGWARPTSLQVGSGGNRIVFNLNRDRAGFDLVHLADGRLRLAINEWPDRVRNDSSPGRLRVGEWLFFAVTYDAALERDNVRWYFGDPVTPAGFDCANTYPAGATGADSGPLTVGNYNTTLHGAGLDRQFRGTLRAIQVFGSRMGGRGALSLDDIRRLQDETRD